MANTFGAGSSRSLDRFTGVRNEEGAVEAMDEVMLGEKGIPGEESRKREASSWSSSSSLTPCSLLLLNWPGRGDLKGDCKSGFCCC